jgi:hypothetical protein
VTDQVDWRETSFRERLIMNKTMMKKAIKAATARAAEKFAQDVFELNIRAFSLGLRIEVVGPKTEAPGKGAWKGTMGGRVDSRGYRVTKARLAALAKARAVRAAKFAAKKG